MSLREAAQAVVESWDKDNPKLFFTAMNTLRAELAKPPPEPVVWMQSDHLHMLQTQACGSDSMLARVSNRKLMDDFVPLYAGDKP